MGERAAGRGHVPASQKTMSVETKNHVGMSQCGLWLEATADLGAAERVVTGIWGHRRASALSTVRSDIVRTLEEQSRGVRGRECRAGALNRNLKV